MMLTELIKERAEALKKEIPLLYLAHKHPLLPLKPRILLIITIGYALSPLDLIPDFIPVLGQVDDLIILPALAALTIKLIPNEILEECRIELEKSPPELKKKYTAAVIIILLWILLISSIIRLILKKRTASL